MFKESEVRMKVKKWLEHHWEALPIIIALILLAVALFKNPVGFQNLAWYGLVALTAIYAYATMRLVRENRRTVEEMKQSRLDAVKPNISLQPGDFTHGGFGALYLVNSGGVAKDVKIDIEVTKPKSKDLLFVPAINREHRVYLSVGDKAQDQGGVVKVDVVFKDGYNQMLSESLSIDFSELKEEGREIWTQYSELSEIKRELSEIKSVLGEIEWRMSR
jgi:hypothetical protein